MKPYYLLALLPLVLAAPAHADDVSKNAGICAAYKAIVKHNLAEAARALQTATNQRLAENHARRWKEELKDNTMHAELLRQAVNACDAIGML
jgi:hypothetical protein